ncbi:MAG: AMP-binding protein [Epsilonproteobacteria bacterium]|nr:AMP-binding protein [Campylobacterota bacterium]
MLIHSYEHYRDNTAFIYRAFDEEFSVSYEKFFDDVLILSKAFASKKITKDSKVMLLSDNRYGWIVTDMALISLGALSVPRGSDTPTQELEFIMKNAECEYLIIENRALYVKHETLIKSLDLKAIFIIEADNVHGLFDHTYSYNDILKDRTITEAELSTFITHRETLTAEDIVTIIYTSGTTGTPKGVLLSHANIMHNVAIIPDLIKLVHEDRWLSILPTWHIFERTAEYTAISKGCCQVYSNVKTFAADLQTYQPTIVATVPRLWESMYIKINAAIKAQGSKKEKLFGALVSISKKYNYNQRVLKDHLPIFTKKTFISQSITKTLALLNIIWLTPLNFVAKKKLQLVQEKFGGKLRLAVSGGGTLPKYLDEWIDALGIRIVNAYGMTECAPAIAGRALNCEIFGTLGPAVPGSEIKIVNAHGNVVKAGEEGEILVKGPQVTPGYHANDEENMKVFTVDGFFKTGDLGKLTQNGELVITGRAKEIIVLANGENIDPSRIESTITMLPFIKDTILVGQDKKGLGALIVPDIDELKSFANEKLHQAIDSLEHLKENKPLTNKFKKEINKLLNDKEGFKPFEKLQNIHFLEKEFTPGEELTNTLKKKRHIIEKKYKAIIDKILN